MNLFWQDSCKAKSWLKTRSLCFIQSRIKVEKLNFVQLLIYFNHALIWNQTWPSEITDLNLANLFVGDKYLVLTKVVTLKLLQKSNSVLSRFVRRLKSVFGDIVFYNMKEVNWLRLWSDLRALSFLCKEITLLCYCSVATHWSPAERKLIQNNVSILGNYFVFLIKIVMILNINSIVLIKCYS